MGTLIVGGSDPVIPPAQQKRALRILNDVNKHVKIMRRFDGRINNLRLFEDFTHPVGHPLAKSRVEWSDHPQIQLLLQRRDRYQALTDQIATYEAVIARFHPDVEDAGGFRAKMEAISSVARLKVQQSKELEAMEVALALIRKEMTVHLHTCQKFVTDMVKISQFERALAKKIGTSNEDLPDDVLDAKLADAE